MRWTRATIAHPTSKFALQFESTPQPGAEARVSWATVAGRSYVIESSSDLVEWVPVFEDYALEDGQMTFAEPLAGPLFLRGRVSVMGAGLREGP